jgi:hypothetical protein
MYRLVLYESINIPSYWYVEDFQEMMLDVVPVPLVSSTDKSLSFEISLLYENEEPVETREPFVFHHQHTGDVFKIMLGQNISFISFHVGVTECSKAHDHRKFRIQISAPNLNMVPFTTSPFYVCRRMEPKGSIIDQCTNSEFQDLRIVYNYLQNLPEHYSEQLPPDLLEHIDELYKMNSIMQRLPSLLEYLQMHLQRMWLSQGEFDPDFVLSRLLHHLDHRLQRWR